MSRPPGPFPGPPSSLIRRAAGKLRRMAPRDVGRPEVEPGPRSLDRALHAPADTAAKAHEPGRREQRALKALARVGRNVVGEEVFPKGKTPHLDSDQVKAVADGARRQRALARFGELIAEGRPLELAHVQGVRALLEAKERHLARALTLGLENAPGGEQIRRVGLGLVLWDMHLYELAWEQLKLVSPDELARLAPLEAATAALRVSSPEAVRVANHIASRSEDFDTATVVDLAGRFLVTGHRTEAKRLVEVAEQRGRDALDEHGVAKLANLRRWTHGTCDVPTVPDAISIGVIDYHQPDFDRASRNVGDYVQTLAMLGNLARFQGVSFSGADGLGEVAGSLQKNIKDGLRIESDEVRAHLVPVSRDFSEGDPVPPETWMLAFGWHMHSMFRLRFGLPYHPNLNPIFVSFHVNRVKTLTPEAIEYLQAHGPIGCRDWTTVDLLLSAGVDAFFTGCLTSTVDAVFPELDDVDRDRPGVVALIDLPKSAVKRANRPVETVSHGDTEYRDMDLASGMQAAFALLSSYQRSFHRIVTSRLHSYLPATSLGIPVSFQPSVAGDVRFDGLLGMEPEKPDFVHMRDSIRELIASTFSRIFAGETKEQVYGHWRAITADLVAEAKRRLSSPPEEPITELDLAAIVSEIRASKRAYGAHHHSDTAEVTDVALSLDQNFKDLLPVTVTSLLRNASGPVRLWITARGLSEDYEAWFARSFENTPVTFLNFDGVDYGEIGRMIRHISVATMDRLLLPEILTDLSRIVYIDIDTVTEGDVTKLGAIDLGGRPLAARTSIYSGAVQWRQAGDLLAAEDASELRRVLSARHAFDFLTFNAGVLVLDLERMRQDRFVERFLPMAARFGLNDQDLLNAYVGPDRVELDPRWNALPVQEIIDDPAIIHFAGAGKPWNPLLVPYGDHWKRYAEDVSRRIGAPPQ